MDGQKFEENKCRICLEEDVELNWNEFLYDHCALTYKQCYYKYTQLEYFDEDNFSTMICRNCSNGLEFIDVFITKATDTHALLVEKCSSIICKDEDDSKQEVTNFETILVEETDIKPDIENLSIYEDPNEEFVQNSEGNVTFNLSEALNTDITQNKQKLEMPIKDEKIENSLDQLASETTTVKKKQKLKIPTCCSICSKVLCSKYKAVQHEKRHHKNRERNETCVKCGLKFFCKMSLRNHMQTHIENREKCHKCEFCDKAFYNRGGLTIHRRIHLGQMIPCTLCTKEFYRQIDLDRHLPSHSAARINSDIKMKCNVKRPLAAEECDSRNMLRIQRRQLRDETDPFMIPEKRFKELYRLSRSAAYKLLDEISPYMHKGKRKTFIPQPIRMCTALHFFATGSFQRDISHNFVIPVSRAVVCRCVQEVSSILEINLLEKWIKFPTEEEYNIINQRFYEETGFPGVIGSVGCTHVRLKKPMANVEDCYLNQNGFHSKNVQMICNYDLKILGAFARFGGATQNADIWEASDIKVLLEQRYQINYSDSWLLGDCCYPLRPWLMTPYRCSPDEEEKQFNNVHNKATKCVKRLIGVLKSVFRCLEVGLHTTPQAAGRIINACCVLHNFRLAHGLDYDDIILSYENINYTNDSPNINEEQSSEPFLIGSRIRDRLKHQFSRC